MTVAFILGIASSHGVLVPDRSYTARLLRPITIVSRIGEQGIRVIESVYPGCDRTTPTFPRPPRQEAGQPGTQPLSTTADRRSCSR